MKLLFLICLAALCAFPVAMADEPISDTAGAQLMAKYNCQSCHSVQDNRSMQGPSLRAIAHKYASYPEGRDEIEAIILNGSSGDWGPNTMPSFDIPQSELRVLITWILAQWP
jgi:cytochrome c551/c552